MANKPHNQIVLSPSAINTFYAHPYKWWLTYHEGYKAAPSIHLIKGSAVHAALETVFEGKCWVSDNNYESELMDKAMAAFNEEWTDSKITPLKLEPEDLAMHRADAENMIYIFVRRLADQIRSLLIVRAAPSAGVALQNLRPKFRELYLKDNDLLVGGYLDCVLEDKNSGSITIVDYKTSKKFKNKMSEEYSLQLAIYAYLYNKQNGVMPTWVAINYLRYGESFYIMVTPALIKWAEEKITYVRSFIDNYQDEEFYKPAPKDITEDGNIKQSTGFLFGVDHERKLLTSPYGN